MIVITRYIQPYVNLSSNYMVYTAICKFIYDLFLNINDNMLNT